MIPIITMGCYNYIMAKDNMLNIYVGDGDFVHGHPGYTFQERMRSLGWLMVKNADDQRILTAYARNGTNSIAHYAGSFAGACVAHAVIDAFEKYGASEAHVSLTEILSSAEFRIEGRGRDPLEIRANDLLTRIVRNNAEILYSSNFFLEPEFYLQQFLKSHDTNL